MEEDATIPAFWKATQSYLKTIVPEYEWQQKKPHFTYKEPKQEMNITKNASGENSSPQRQMESGVPLKLLCKTVDNGDLFNIMMV